MTLKREKHRSVLNFKAFLHILKNTFKIKNTPEFLKKRFEKRDRFTDNIGYYSHYTFLGTYRMLHLIKILYTYT